MSSESTSKREKQQLYLQVAEKVLEIIASPM
ncbi:hypothetical protein SAMN02744102_04079 [Paenibacillus barengoltzii]|nr:hypothetical protein SAMN02744102_04079 [Paenibacillus barengoltzii]